MRKSFLLLHLLCLLFFSCNSDEKKAESGVQCTHILKIAYDENNRFYKVITFIQRRIVNKTNENIYFFLSPLRIKDIEDSNKIVHPIGLYEWRKFDSLVEDDRWIIPPDTASSNKLKNYIINKQISDRESWLPTFLEDLIFIKKNTEIIIEYPSYGLFKEQEENSYKIFTPSIGKFKRSKFQARIESLFPKEFEGYRYWQDELLTDTLRVNVKWQK